MDENVDALTNQIKEFFLSTEFQDSFASTVANKVSEALTVPLERIGKLEVENKTLQCDVAKLQQEVFMMKNRQETQTHTNKTQAIMNESGKLKNVVMYEEPVVSVARGEMATVF